jgi:hypothetical protein
LEGTLLMIWHPFETFFQRRREYNVDVDVEDKGTFRVAELALPDQRVLTTNWSKEGPEEAIYQSNYAQFCDKSNSPDVPDIITHDFCAPAETWINPDSTFVWSPTPLTKLELQEVTVSCWRDMVIPEDNKIFMVVWEAITAPCPVFSGSRTPFGVPGDPTWAAVYPPARYGNQEVTVYVKFDLTDPQNPVPLFKASVFSYDKVSTMRQKAREVRYAEASAGFWEMSCWFPYKERKIDITLRSSMNERIECFLEDGVPLSAGASGLPATASAVMHSYYEW